MESGSEQVSLWSVPKFEHSFRHRSGRLDSIMSALNFSWIKRKAVQFHKSETELDLSSVCVEPDTHLTVTPPNTTLNIITYLPLKYQKQAVVFLNGEMFEVEVGYSSEFSRLVYITCLLYPRIPTQGLGTAPQDLSMVVYSKNEYLKHMGLYMTPEWYSRHLIWTACI